MPRWYAETPRPPDDVIAWPHPNATGVQSKIRAAIGGRCIAWRPILYWRKGGPIRFRRGERIDPNYLIESQVMSNMSESVAWPNQLPLRLVTWLLRPHVGRVLDLFAGTGTTRAAALSLGLSVTSVDKSPQAVRLTQRRSVQIGLPVVGRALHENLALPS